MVSAPWSQEEIMFFLTTLQSEPVLWDPNERGHNRKKKIKEAWLRIRDHFDLPIEDLKRKKESIFATYRGYRRKVEASIQSGATIDQVYRPVWFAFDFMNSFLGPVFIWKQPNATENDNSGAVEPIIYTTSKEQISIEQSQAKRAIRRRTVAAAPPEAQVGNKQMTDAFNNLNKIINNKLDEDECDVFGKLIAKKLKKLPEHEREDVMFDIHALFKRPRVEIAPPI